MLTHFETLITLLGAVIGLLAALIGTVWRARGWVDQLNATDSRLADAIEALTRTQQQQHAENQARFLALERGRWVPPRSRGR
jgi:hypothetical protein